MSECHWIENIPLALAAFIWYLLKETIPYGSDQL